MSPLERLATRVYTLKPVTITRPLMAGSTLINLERVKAKYEGGAS